MLSYIFLIVHQDYDPTIMFILEIQGYLSLNDDVGGPNTFALLVLSQRPERILSPGDAGADKGYNHPGGCGIRSTKTSGIYPCVNQRIRILTVYSLESVGNPD